MAYDLLIKNGKLIDGTGAPARHADVAIADGKIASHF
jgi:N-acyl-D-aspartate/D-glutamate deacylase